MSADRRPTVVVLGASGLLGTAVTRALAGRPIRLRLVGRRNISVPGPTVADIEVHPADLLEPGSLQEAVRGVDAVIHLVSHHAGAANWRVSTGDAIAERVNVGLVEELVKVLQPTADGRPPAVLFAGSVSQAIADNAGTKDLISDYDRHKAGAEQILLSATESGDVRATVLRLATLYSCTPQTVPLDRGVTASMTRRALAGEPLTVWGDGRTRRDLLTVTDAAAAFSLALSRIEQLAGSHWQIGSGLQVCLQELFGLIAERVSVCTGEDRVPVVNTAPADYSVATDLHDFIADPAPFRQLTGWAPLIPLTDGLDRLAESLSISLSAPATTR